jgi:hypothetical protein
MSLTPFALSELVDVDNFEDQFALRLERMLIDARLEGRVRISSGYRTTAQQERLYADYIRRDRRPPRVAKPGTSNHERGLAADLDLAWRTPFGWPYVHGIAQEYGLTFPVPGEPWHVEPRRGAPPLTDPEPPGDELMFTAAELVTEALMRDVPEHDFTTGQTRQVALVQLLSDLHMELGLLRRALEQR